jgi:GT2 family glycosyltransferase
MRTVIGIITYGKSTAKYLPYFLASIKEQTDHDFELYVYDNTDDGSVAYRETLDGCGLDFKIFRSGTNLGFAKAYNVLINQAIKAGAEYFLAVNPDMVFEPSFLSRLTSALDSEKSAGAVTAKILRWDFANRRKTQMIDSLGIVADKYFRFFDDQQGLPDSQALTSRKEIFGFTGATALLRLEALRDVAFKREFFDELMFMYKEDCDLSMRLRLAGWKIILEPLAIAYHDRTAANVGQSVAQIAGGRKFKSRKVKQWSFLNQLILLYKFDRILPLRIRIPAWTYEMLSIGYASIFEPFLLKELQTFIRLRKQAKEKSLAMLIKSDLAEFARNFK